MIRDSDWYARRAKGIGGSDAATILGVSPFKSPLRLWMEKRGEIEPEDLDAKEHIYWGIMLERVICEEYTRRTGRAVREVGEIYQHPQHPWMLCNVDRDVILSGANAPRVILEAKNVSLYHFNAADWGMEGTAQVPPYYYTQCQHNCAVTDAVQCDLPALIGGNNWRLYSIPRDERFIAGLIRREQAFWESLQTGVAPEPVKISDLHLMFPASAPGIHIDADEETAREWALLAQCKTELKRWKAEALQHEFALKKAMGDAEHLSFNGAKLATWRTGKSGRRTFRVHTSGIGAEDEAGDSD